MALLLQEVCFGPNVVVGAHIRLSERDSRVNRKLLRATLMQPGLAELTISEMLPQDLDADLVSCTATWHVIAASQAPRRSHLGAPVLCAFSWPVLLACTLQMRLMCRCGC